MWVASVHTPANSGAIKDSSLTMISPRIGQKNHFNSANIDKWREVFAGKILSQVEYQQPIGEGTPLSSFSS